MFTNDASTPIVATFVFSDTGYDDSLLTDAPQSLFIVDAWQDPVGTSLAFGPYAMDSEVIFGIDVQNTGLHWQSGPGSRNSDGVVHVSITYEGGCSWVIGFEDLEGGGDLDFNDVVLRVQGELRQEQ